MCMYYVHVCVPGVRFQDHIPKGTLSSESLRTYWEHEWSICLSASAANIKKKKKITHSDTNTCTYIAHISPSSSCHYKEMFFMLITRSHSLDSTFFPIQVTAPVPLLQHIISAAALLWICEWSAAEVLRVQEQLMNNATTLMCVSPASSESLATLPVDAKVIAGICFDVKQRGEVTCVSWLHHRDFKRPFWLPLGLCDCPPPPHTDLLIMNLSKESGDVFFNCNVAGSILVQM